MTDLVFVYGSLKRGYHGHDQMKGADYEGAALTALPRYQMLACPWPGAPHEAYPALITVAEHDRAAGFVTGEVYAVSASLMARLDEFENVGQDYTRELIGLADGRQAWVYLSLNLEGQKAAAAHKRIGFDEAAKTYTWLNVKKG